MTNWPLPQEVRETVIVGAGPVGLTAALGLARRGHPVLLIERDEVPTTEWRASTFHAPTLEMCHELGIVDTMHEQGLIAEKYQLRDRTHGLMAEFDFGVLEDTTAYPYRLQLEQYKYSQILRDELAALGIVPLVGVSVDSVSQTADGVELVVSRGDETATVRAPRVIGANGARSTIRKSLGIEFDGSTYEHRYLLLSVDAPLETLCEGICLVNYIADPDEHLMLLRIPDLWRVMFEVAPDVDEEVALSDDYIRAKVAGLIGEVDLAQVPSRQLYRVHQRVAETFHRGDVFLMGDAAHVNSPIGGMGLNSGIHDAYEFVAAFDKVAHGADPNIEFAAWAAKRRQIALEEIQRITHANTALLKGGDAEAENKRRMSEIAADADRTRSWLLEASMIAMAQRHNLPVPSAAVA